MKTKPILISSLFILLFSISFSQSEQEIVNHFENKVDSIEKHISKIAKNRSLDGLHTDGYCTKFIVELGYFYEDIAWYKDTLFKYKEVRGLFFRKKRFTIIFSDNKPIMFSKNKNPFSAHYQKPQKPYYIDWDKGIIYNFKGEVLSNKRKHRFIIDYCKKNLDYWKTHLETYSRYGY